MIWTTEPEEIGALVFWELKSPDGGKYIPFQLNLNFKPSRWELFKFRLLGVRWVDFKRNAL